jgi:hypothetical protein
MSQRCHEPDPRRFPAKFLIGFSAVPRVGRTIIRPSLALACDSPELIVLSCPPSLFVVFSLSCSFSCFLDGFVGGADSRTPPFLNTLRVPLSVLWRVVFLFDPLWLSLSLTSACASVPCSPLLSSQASTHVWREEAVSDVPLLGFVELGLRPSPLAPAVRCIWTPSSLHTCRSIRPPLSTPIRTLYR